jgi:hypothetical protein
VCFLLHFALLSFSSISFHPFSFFFFLFFKWINSKCCGCCWCQLWPSSLISRFVSLLWLVSLSLYNSYSFLPFALLWLSCLLFFI